MWTPINRDWTTKPPLGTPLRTDGHWSVQGLVGCWLFNEGAGGNARSLTDNKTAAISGAVWTEGGINNIHSTDTIIAPANINFNLSGKMTVVTCITPTDLADRYNVLMSQDDYGKRLLVVPVSDYGYRSILVQYGTLLYYSAAGTMVGKRTAITYTCGTSGQKIYENGVMVAQDGNTDGTLSASVPLHIANRTGAGYYWLGITHYAMVYNRALSPNEIASLSANPYQVCQP